jgi:Tfp pilus assembly protein PilN
MRVKCNFLPVEQRAFILERKVMGLSVLLYVITVGIFAIVFMAQKKDADQLTKQIKSKELERAGVQEERNQMQYPQERIQRLIDHFSFIQKAMGVNDFPWLRFYQSLEDSIPLSDSGRRGVYVTRLDRQGEKQWQLEGEAEDWKDAARFEESLAASAYASGAQAKKNFAEVRLLNYRALDGAKGYRFRIQFLFNDVL